MEDRFEDLPETFNEMMLLPNVPDFRTAHGHLTKVHQVITAGCAFLKKEERDGPKSLTVGSDATRRDVNAPGGSMQNQRFFPLSSILLVPINGKGVIAFPCND